MSLSIEDMSAIKNELDDRYVMQADCNEKQEQVSHKFANDDKRIDMLVSKTKAWDKLLWTIATTGVGAFVAEIINLIKGG